MEKDLVKFQEMNEKQQDAIKQVILIALNVRSQEEQKYTHEFYRLLVLGNGMGMVLLATFMGAVVHNNGQVSMLKTPLDNVLRRSSRCFGLRTAVGCC